MGYEHRPSTDEGARHERRDRRTDQAEPGLFYVSNRPYKRSHLTEPRGRGAWAFCSYTGGVEEGEPVFFSGTLTEARSTARKHFAALGIQEIAVLP